MEDRRRGVILNRFLLALLLASSLSLGLRPGPAGAATAGVAITVLQSQATSDFPKQLRFEVVAQSLAQITSVRIVYRVGDDPISVEATASFTPGFRVDATRAIDLQREYYPPGVALHFQWLIQDISGAELDTPLADLPIVDRRFLWHQNTQGGVVLHWYAGDSRFSDAVLSTAANALATAQRDAGSTSTTPVDVYLYANDQDFRSSIGGDASAWVGGLTFPAYHDVLVLAPITDVTGVQRSVAHEMTHVAIDTTADDPFGPLPTWLDEGLAMNAEGPPDPVFVQALQVAERGQSLTSIQAISGTFPDATEGATLAYAESDSVVRYFTQKYGKNKLSLLIAGFRQGESSDEAFRQSIGLTTLQFQQGWRSSLGQQPTTVAPSSPPGSGVLRALTAPIDLVVNVVRDLLQRFQSGKGGG